MMRIDRRRLMTGAAAMSIGTVLAPQLHAQEVIARGVSGGERRKVAEIVAAFMSQQRAPGVSVAYAREGTLSYVSAFGVADEESGEQLTPAHRFRVASVSKPITAAAVMLLVERGELSLDQVVFGEGGVLAETFPVPRVNHADWVRKITIDHLLTHTEGGWSNDNDDPMFRNSGMDHGELIAATLRDLPLQHEPGIEHAYSNFGYAVLGRVIEEISGQGYEQFVKAEILDPAGAGGMEIAGNALADRKPNEVVYFGQEDEDPYVMDVARMDAHGGWIGSATDLVNFAMHVDGYSSVPDLLSEGTIRTMRTASEASPWYARGWSVNPPNHNNWWHNGSLPGTSSILIRVENGVSMAGLVNTRRWGDPDTNSALDTLMWEVYEQVIGG